MNNASIINLKDYNPEVGKRRKVDYCERHQLISNAIKDYFVKNLVLPTTVQLSRELNLSQKCIRKHRKELSYELLSPEFKELTPQIILTLYAKCLAGSVFAIKLWLQFVHGWKEKDDSDAMSQKNVQDIFGPHARYFGMNADQLRKELKKELKKESKEDETE